MCRACTYRRCAAECAGTDAPLPPPAPASSSSPAPAARLAPALGADWALDACAALLPRDNGFVRAELGIGPDGAGDASGRLMPVSLGGSPLAGVTAAL
jgi:hypothetical protein